MKNLILFDFDGTLADTAPDLAAAANRMRTKRNMSALPYEDLRPFASHGARGLIKAALNVDTNASGYEELKQEFLSDYEQNMVNSTTLFAGIQELLDNLSSQNLSWGIVTNKTEALALPIIKYLGLDKYSAVNVGGDTTPFSKPNPEPLLYAARQTGTAPENCIYIGDDERDIIAGKAANMDTVVAAYGYCYLDNPATWNAHYMANTPENLNQIISLWLEKLGANN